YGGSGGDVAIGGEGDDSIDGGTGDDRLSGDADPYYNGLAPEDANHAGNDVIAGDALNNMHALPEEEVEEIIALHGPATHWDAIAIIGGNDSIWGGNGADKISGDAL